MNKMNPLSKYTKVEVLYTKLPTNNVIKYPQGVLESDSVECGVCARSARDELAFNNPDALMNGEAVVNVIQNCVPNVINARELYVPDVELLLIAIKVATKETEYHIEAKCPVCDHHGSFERNLKFLLDSAGEMETQPELLLEDAGGLLIKFRPQKWGEFSKFGQAMFQEQKQAQVLEKNDTMSEEDKMKVFKDIFERMTQLSFDIMVATIDSITTPDGSEVTDKGFIKEWLGTQPSYVLREIRTVTDELNNFGVSHEMEVGCSACNHEWTLTDLQFDPSHFFAQSF